MSDVGRYRKVFPRLWRHPGFAGLKPSTRELVLYLLCGPQTNAIGLFHFSIATAAEDLNVSVQTVRRGVTDVSVTFGWLFDADARVLYIPSWWRWNRPENRFVLTGNLKALSEIPPCSLVDAFASNTKWLPSEPPPDRDKGGKTCVETFLEGVQTRLPKRPPVQEQEQEHLSGTKQEHEPALRAKRAKNGIERSDLLPVAREAVRLNHLAAPNEVFVETFRHLHREQHPHDEVSLPEVERLVAVVLQEQRPS